MSKTSAAPHQSTESHLDTETVQHRSCSTQQDAVDFLPAQNLEVGAGSNNDDLDESGQLDNEFIALNKQEEQR